jgi:DNA modification methylase
MVIQKLGFKTEEELQEAILQEKVKGTPDVEIGRKYGVTFRYLERLITRSQGLNVSSLKLSKRVKNLYPKDFKEEQTSVWSFKQRGNWATHSGEYRGNWSPYIPRNVILKYSKPGELVLDYFCGAGTTAVEAKLLGRRCIAFDINDKAIELAKKNVDFHIEPKQLSFTDDEIISQVYEPELRVGDARNLSFLQNNSIDLICAHPPYSNIIHYTDYKKDDLSFYDVDDFLKEMSEVAKESFRVLKPERQCAILIGDMRKRKHVIPLGFKLINVYLNAGFKLRELVIKRQHNCKTTGFWYANSIKHNFLLLAHEYLPIFEKPKLSTPSGVAEVGLDYGLVVPIVKKPPLKKKIDELETTTVWVLPERDFEKRLNRNVINRYSNKGRYSTISFIFNSGNDVHLIDNKGGNKRLLFIKSPFLNNNPSQASIEIYLQRAKEIISGEILTISDGGFVVIQTQDVRMADGYVEPLAKKMFDLFTFRNLWLREIVVVTQQDTKLGNGVDNSNLKIDHQYLLVYEKAEASRKVEHT